MCLQFGFVIFWQKDFGPKAAHKMLVKLTPGVEGQKTFFPLSRMVEQDQPKLFMPRKTCHKGSCTLAHILEHKKSRLFVPCKNFPGAPL
jgi:hypothetical protein